MTVEEEFEKLADDLRRLKIEYEVYFNGGAPRPPQDTLYRVDTMIRRFSSEQSKLNFSQRFRFTSLVQKHAVYTQLWRRKLQEKEEGRSLGGPQRRSTQLPESNILVRIVCTDPQAEAEKVNRLWLGMQQGKKRLGESADGLDAAAFLQFIKDKTKQVQETLGCTKVQFTVSIEEGKVKLKAGKAD